MFVHCHCQNIHYYCQNRHFTPKYTLWMVLLVEPHLYTALLGGWVKEDVGCKTGTLHCCCRVDATADSRSRLLRLQNKPNILPFVCKKCSSCQKTCISATVRLHPYVTLGYDCLLDPSWDCLMAPNQSVSTSIGLTSGWGYPLKNLPYSCKYSAGETLKVWGARGAITIAKRRKAPIYQIVPRVLHL